ncbi:hypothetical protein EB796_006655 [Bugula neritina]|nr:hypothetical protein EB796_006655 [Bugula neritina]
MSHFTLEFEQKAGELLFIPTGWAHQAYNLEESLAISSQFMNRNNYKSVLEEVIQCTGVESRLPHTYLTLTPEEQVKVVMSLLPESVLDSAKRSNEEVRERLMCGENSL